MLSTKQSKHKHEAISAYRTCRTSVTARAAARERVDRVVASSAILTWRRRALVDIRFAVRPSESGQTLAGIRVDSIHARSAVDASTAPAIIDVYLAIDTSVSGLKTSKIINLLEIYGISSNLGHYVLEIKAQRRRSSRGVGVEKNSSDSKTLVMTTNAGCQ